MKKFFAIILVVFIGACTFAIETNKTVIHQEKFLKYETNSDGLVVSITANNGYCLFITTDNVDKYCVEYGGNGCKTINFKETGFLHGWYTVLVFPEGKFEYQRKAETMVGKEFRFCGIK